MNLYKVTMMFNGKTTEIQVRTSSRRAAITRASLHLIPLDNKRDKAEVSFSCEFVKSLPRGVPISSTTLTAEQETAIKRQQEECKKRAREQKKAHHATRVQNQMTHAILYGTNYKTFVTCDVCDAPADAVFYSGSKFILDDVVGAVCEAHKNHYFPKYALFLDDHLQPCTNQKPLKMSQTLQDKFELELEKKFRDRGAA
jgi:hypothetical protein